MTDKEKGDQQDDSLMDPGRRRFLKNTGIFAGGIVGGSLFGGLLTNTFQTKPETAQEEQLFQEARVFFSREEDFQTLSAAVERIFPENENGPGAIELGVPNFIDKQLSSFWGTNAFVYMKGPFLQTEFVKDYERQSTEQSKSGQNASAKPSIPSPRYQTRLNRGEVFLVGLQQLQKEAGKKYDSPFYKLEPEEQDEILTAFEKGEVDIPGVHTKPFFHLLVQTTLEGAYADPVYGGNKKMAGWKMKEYPGPRAAYMNEIDAEEFIVMEPKSLKDYQG